jgi:hypothetical protein
MMALRTDGLVEVTPTENGRKLKRVGKRVKSRTGSQSARPSQGRNAVEHKKLLRYSVCSVYYRNAHRPSHGFWLIKSSTMRHSFAKAIFDPNNFKTYTAQCHCGTVRLEVDVSPPLEKDHEVVTCNCMTILLLNSNATAKLFVGSMCFRTGSYNVYLPVDRVRFLRGQDDIKVRPTSLETPVVILIAYSRTNTCPSPGISVAIVASI